MFGLMACSPIAFDIGTCDVWAAQIRQAHKGPVVRALAHRRLSRDADACLAAPDGLPAVLKDIVRRGGFRGKRAIIHLPSNHVFSFPVGFQLGKDEVAENAIIREARDALPFAYEDAILDYASLRTVPDVRPTTYRATVVTIRRDAVERYLGAFRSAGLVPEVIDIGTAALARVYARQFTIGDQPVMFCRIDQAQTMLSVVTRDALLAQHHVDWGLRQITEKIAANLELGGDPHAAEAQLAKYGVARNELATAPRAESGPARDAARRIGRIIDQLAIPILEQLIYEMHTIVGYVRSEMAGAAIERICLFGAGNGVPGLDAFMSKRMGLPVERAAPLNSMRTALPRPPANDAYAYALALGLALRSVPWL